MQVLWINKNTENKGLEILTMMILVLGQIKELFEALNVEEE